MILSNISTIQHLRSQSLILNHQQYHHALLEPLNLKLLDFLSTSQFSICMEDLQSSPKSHTSSDNSSFEIKDEPDHRITELFRLEKTLRPSPTRCPKATPQSYASKTASHYQSSDQPQSITISQQLSYIPANSQISKSAPLLCPGHPNTLEKTSLE